MLKFTTVSMVMQIQSHALVFVSSLTQHKLQRRHKRKQGVNSNKVSNTKHATEVNTQETVLWLENVGA